MKVIILTTIFLMMGIFGFIPDKSLSLRLAQEIFSDTTIIFFIAMFLVRNIWIKCFLILNLISLTMVSMIYQSAEASLISRFSFMTIFVYVIGYQIMANIIKKEQVINILNAICIVAIMQCTLIILQTLNIWIFFNPKGGEATGFNVACGFLGNTNISGSFLALTIPAFLRKKWCWFLLLICTCLVINRCLGSIIASVAGLIFYSFQLKSKIKYYIAMAIVVLGMTYYTKYDPIKFKQYNSLGIRLFHWRQTIERLVLKDHKKLLLGWGIGQYKVFYPMLQRTSDMYKNTYPYKPEAIHKQAHNEYIQVMTENGLIGIMIILIYLISLFIRYLKRKSYLTTIVYTGIIISMVNSCVHFLFHTTTGVLALLYMALFEVITLRRYKYV